MYMYANWSSFSISLKKKIRKKKQHLIGRKKRLPSHLSSFAYVYFTNHKWHTYCYCLHSRFPFHTDGFLGLTGSLAFPSKYLTPWP